MIINIAQTLKGIFGHESTLHAAEPDVLGIRLPALTMRQFEFFVGRLSHADSPVLCVVSKEKLPLRIIENTYLRMREQFGGPVLFYFEKLSTRDRQRLSGRKVQFMVADRFLYAPLLGIVGATRNLIAADDNLIERRTLSPTAETILIGQLLDGRYGGFSGKEIAEALQVTPAAASQALQELEKQGFVQLIRTGKEKNADFEERSILWRTALKIIRNPVEAELPMEAPPANALKAGLSALAASGMLVEPDVATWAAYKRNFEQPESRKTSAIESAKEHCNLQLWRRDPRIHSEEGRVDPISLYLSLQRASDERTQKELAGLLEKLGLEVPNGQY